MNFRSEKLIATDRETVAKEKNPADLFSVRKVENALAEEACLQTEPEKKFKARGDREFLVILSFIHFVIVLLSSCI